MEYKEPKIRDAVVERVPLVDETFGYLEKSINKLGGEIENLGSKLVPVLRHTDATEKEGVPTDVLDVPLAQSIKELRLKVDYIIMDVEDILSRLEI